MNIKPYEIFKWFVNHIDKLLEIYHIELSESGFSLYDEFTGDDKFGFRLYQYKDNGFIIFRHYDAGKEVCCHVEKLYEGCFGYLVSLFQRHRVFRTVAQVQGFLHKVKDRC